MKIHEIKVDHEPRESRAIMMGIGLIQMLEEACLRSGSTNRGTKQEAIFRAMARQLAAVRAASE